MISKKKLFRLTKYHAMVPGISRSSTMQYLLQRREGALLLLLQSFDLLEQTASLQTQTPDLLKHLFILCLRR